MVHDELFTTVVNHGLGYLDALWNKLRTTSHENDWELYIDEFVKDTPPPSVFIEWIDNIEMVKRREKERLRYRDMYGRERFTAIGERDREVTDLENSNSSNLVPSQ